MFHQGCETSSTSSKILPPQFMSANRSTMDKIALIFSLTTYGQAPPTLPHYLLRILSSPGSKTYYLATIKPMTKRESTIEFSKPTGIPYKNTFPICLLEITQHNGFYVQCHTNQWKKALWIWQRDQTRWRTSLNGSEFNLILILIRESINPNREVCGQFGALFWTTFVMLMKFIFLMCSWIIPFFCPCSEMGFL